jgi:hypothetical protein
MDGIRTNDDERVSRPRRASLAERRADYLF